MKNWEINGDTGNIVVKNGSFSTVESDSAIAQNARATLHHALQEWFLNRDSGIDFFGQVLVKRPDIAKITRILKRAIRNADGIASIESFSLERSGKKIICQFSAITVNNELFTLQETIP